ncbi:MAG: deoxynucleoside kinase [Candidatus Babeliales bacterium]
MYILEGNIGAGKSTFLKLIASYLPHVSVAFEPMHNWQNKIYGQSLLANFYQDPKRWAYTLEILAMICRVREHMTEQEAHTPYKITERSIYSGHYCFAKNDYESGFMTEVEWQIYNQWFQFLIPGKCNPPKGFIYLYVEPEIAYERIKKRSRLTEKQISLSYLKQIHAKHEEFLVHQHQILGELHNVPLLILDCNRDFEQDPVEFAMHGAKIEAFLVKTQQSSITSKFPSTMIDLY